MSQQLYRPARTPNRTTLGLAALVLLAFALRAINLTGESLWRDEVDIVRFTLQPAQVLLRSFTQTGFNGPLYLLLMRPWLALAGVNDFALRYFSLLCSVALVVLVWVLARRWVGPRAAWVTAGLLAVSPVHIWYAGEGKMYTLQPALLVLALYALARVLGPLGPVGPVRPVSPQATRRSNARWWLVFIVATSCAFYVHILSPLFLSVAVIVFIANWTMARRHVRGAIVALGCLTLPYVPLLIWQGPTLVRGSNTGHVFRPLGTMAQSLLSDWSFGFGINAPLFFAAQPGWVRWACMGLFAGLALIGFIRLVTRRPGLALGLLAWLTLPTLAVYAISTRAPVFEPRYLLWCAPALFMLVGAALDGSRGQAKWRTFISLALFSTLIGISLLGLAAQIARPIRPDMRGATQLVAAQIAAQIAAQLQADSVVVFQIPYGRYGFEYYLRFQPIERAPQIVEAPYTNYGMSEAEVAQILKPAISAVSANHDIWLIELEPAMWDARGLVRRWFDVNLQRVEQRAFNGIIVSRYRLQSP